jgi:hypothetical protein
MKKILLLALALSFTFTGLSVASAQYYGAYSYDASYMSGGYTNTSYSNSYPSPQHYYGHGNSYSGGIGSYTIGCTTYYYSTRTGSVLYTSYTCNTYQYTQPTCYYTCAAGYNYTYSSPYYTYGYTNGNWYPGYSSSFFGNNYNNGYQNYLNCYYDQYGRYICY